MDENFEKRLVSVEESVRTIANFVRNEIDNIKSINEEIQVLQTSTEKINTDNRIMMSKFNDKIEMIDEMNSKLSELGITTGAGDNTEMRSAVDKVNNMSASVASISKHLHDVEKELVEIREMKESRSEKVNMKEVSASINKLVVKNFEEFAKVMDRKIPHLMTREEHVKHMEELNKKLNNIQAPDVSGIARRVDMMEKKIDDMYSFIQGMYDKIPTVVE